jgi:ATP-dependent helicase Lhr and Lhr-like helicase
VSRSLPSLPDPFDRWFARRGWSPRDHQLEMLAAARAGDDALLIAPTGAGKTLAGFLPSLLALSGPERPRGGGAHTIYVSPLKALATDVRRNLLIPVEEMGLPVTVEARTGDTPQARRARQRLTPPDILLTTPEQMMLLIGAPDAPHFFRSVERIIVDEIHALAPGKRGDMLALCLAAIRRWRPQVRLSGLSATVADEAALQRWLGGPDVRIVRGPKGADADIGVLLSEERVPWSGHTGRHAIPEVYRAIAGAGVSLVFVNTRFQAELAFQELWRINDDGLAIALHHGSLSVEQRRKVEAAMADGRLRAVVCTSTLDLGIDWGDVDLVIQMGAPKGSARLTQRIGRANHRLDAPSRALLTPTNRFEMLECIAALEAVAAGKLDGPPPRTGGLDMLAQFILGRACGDPFRADDLYAEVTSAAPYGDLPRATFDRVLQFVCDGGYALKSYDAFRKIVRLPDGRWRARSKDVESRWRMNVGAIVESPMLKVRLGAPRKGPDGQARPGGGRAGRVLGEIEEYFAETLSPGDTFLFAGEILRFEGIAETTCMVTRSSATNPKVPSYAGGKFPLSTFLAEGVRRLIADRSGWGKLHPQLVEWLEHQAERSVIPATDEMLIETFPRAGRHYLVAYPFEGRLAHQTLGMLLTRRLERAGRKPLGFVANDYALSIWSMDEVADIDMAQLFDEDMLGDDLDAWLAESVLMKRTFRTCAVIAGLIERRFPGQEKTGRQITFSTDLIYDVLRSHEPDHILMQSTWADAGEGLLDIRRLGDMLGRVKGKIAHIDLPRISPFAVPLLLEIGVVPVHGAAQEAILADAETDLVREAMA